MAAEKTSGLSGLDVIKSELGNMPLSPGVYRMLDQSGQALYVGKAKNLRNRVSSYLRIEQLVPRLQHMVMATARMEITTTRTESEALLLESSLIKSLKPRYNILLRDDKSFPYIMITGAARGSAGAAALFPRITKHRGAKKQENHYFGPYASSNAVHQAITTLQKAFLLRNCTDAFFANRKRPCLEFQIKRCSAPCVGYVSEAEYNRSVTQALAFLSGKSGEIQKELQGTMQEAADALEYEKAATYRNRIAALNTIQQKQGVSARDVQEADIIALAGEGDIVCVTVLFIRGGHILGHKNYFPAQVEGLDAAETMEAFLGRFYQSNTPPKLLLLSHDAPARKVLELALSELRGSAVRLTVPQRGEKRALVETAVINARTALDKHRNETANERELMESVAAAFGLEDAPERIEVFDNSHLFGKYPVGAMIVAGPEGFVKSAYRKFTVDPGEKTTGGDDFGMLRQVLLRRYKKLQTLNPERDRSHGEARWPDLALIDGGAAHLRVAQDALNELGITDLPLACIAKGPERNAGIEEYHLPGKPPFRLPKNSPVAFYMQRIRDEAHRFAINSYRKKHTSSLLHSSLSEIPGIGAARKKALLQHFGSLALIKEASIKELTGVPGINQPLAETIHAYFHSERPTPG